MEALRLTLRRRRRALSVRYETSLSEVRAVVGVIEERYISAAVFRFAIVISEEKKNGREESSASEGNGRYGPERQYARKDRRL